MEKITRCEFYEYGYCTYDKTIQEQEETETFWNCDGSEENQILCGIKEDSEDE